MSPAAVADQEGDIQTAMILPSLKPSEEGEGVGQALPGGWKKNRTMTSRNSPLSKYFMKIEALCAAPPEALTHSPSQMPLSCPVAPQAARRPLRLRPRGHAPRNTSLRRRTNYLEPQRLRPLRHAPNTSPGCRSCASAPSPAAPAGVREEHYSRNARSARNLGARNRDAAIVRCRCDDALGLPWCCSAHAC